MLGMGHSLQVQDGWWLASALSQQLADEGIGCFLLEVLGLFGTEPRRVI